jgi:homoserine O-acetyltransferase/O-succinyltransferase
MKEICKLAALCLAVLSAAAFAADYQPREASWIAKNFRFSTGEVLPEVRLNYTTIGASTGEAVLVLHGTAGSAASLLNKDFADELFAPGQPLDAARYYIILPDALGTGKSTRPSDGLRAKFPRYNYDDMVHAQHRLLTEGLGIQHLRLVIGNSMGGMQAWLWATKYPSFMDALVPMACLPVAMSGRNHMLRRMLTQAIRNDPDWKGGDYTVQPPNMQRHLLTYGLATIGGNVALYKQAPNYRKGDEFIAQRLAVPFRGDANDTLYQWESSADYDPSLGLERVRAMVLAINAVDDERNPPELGVMEDAMKRLKNARYVLLPLGPDSRGHGTTGQAKLWKQYLVELLHTAPKR